MYRQKIFGGTQPTPPSCVKCLKNTFGNLLCPCLTNFFHLISKQALQAVFLPEKFANASLNVTGTLPNLRGQITPASANMAATIGMETTCSIPVDPECLKNRDTTAGY